MFIHCDVRLRMHFFLDFLLLLKIIINFTQNDSGNLEIKLEIHGKQWWENSILSNFEEILDDQFRLSSPLKSSITPGIYPKPPPILLLNLIVCTLIIKNKTVQGKRPAYSVNKTGV